MSQQNKPMTNSRRKFLTGTATDRAAALALSAFPPSIRRALAIPANNKTGTIQDVEHVVILMQENRSFDHYFGMLKGVRGFGDRFTIPLPKGLSVWQQSDAAASRAALPPGPEQGQRAARERHAAQLGRCAKCLGRRPHVPMAALQEVSTARRWATSRKRSPFQFALANAFTICDSYHCGMHTGTTRTASFHWTGTNGPTGANVAGT
jgi:phospholipase C